MSEEQKDLQAPPLRHRYKLFKFMTLTLLLLALFVGIGFTGLKATSSSSFCSSCHEMKPEYYTWKASAHSEVDCVNCHIEPGAKNLVKDKANGLVQVYRKATNTYTAPIQMPGEISNSACERCHNMSTRNVNSSGDLIIPHDKHLKKDIECTQCHSGVAHGKVAERKMTFQTDYDKWDKSLGKNVMADLKFSRPDMDTCIECHKARKVSTECKTCHTTGMEPKSHKNADFKTKTHGILAGKELEKCNQCHKDMSKNKLDGYVKSTNILETQQPIKNQYDYARENTFCANCHNKRPASHKNQFFSQHSNLAEGNKDTCLACHDEQKRAIPSTNNVNCYSCHPSSHSQNKNFRQSHPVPVAQNQKPNGYCYTCHVKKTCTSCHKD
jgi:nitrate/TMAO reductase-like tetraheme cytochrome c subunit